MHRSENPQCWAAVSAGSPSSSTVARRQGRLLVRAVFMFTAKTTLQQITYRHSLTHARTYTVSKCVKTKINTRLKCTWLWSRTQDFGQTNLIINVYTQHQKEFKAEINHSTSQTTKKVQKETLKIFLLQYFLIEKYVWLAQSFKHGNRETQFNLGCTRQHQISSQIYWFQCSCSKWMQGHPSRNSSGMSSVVQHPARYCSYQATKLIWLIMTITHCHCDYVDKQALIFFFLLFLSVNIFFGSNQHSPSPISATVRYLQGKKKKTRNYKYNKIQIHTLCFWSKYRSEIKKHCGVLW